MLVLMWSRFHCNIAIPQIFKFLFKKEMIDLGRRDPGSNFWQPHNLFESVALVQEKEPYGVGQREN